MENFFGQNVRFLRKLHNLNQEQLANRLGYKSFTTIQKWETEKAEPTLSTINALAELFNVKLEDLVNQDLSTDEFIGSIPAAVRINVYGKIPAGTPLEAIEDIIDWEEIPADWRKGGKEYFALQVEGDSMYPVYLEGDIIICQVQPDFEDGQDCVVFVNGYDATLKRCYHTAAGIRLVPINTNYSPMSYEIAESSDQYGMDDIQVHVLGVVKEIRRKM